MATLIPDPDFGSMLTRERSTFAASRWAKSRLPKSSLPTQPMKAVLAPARAAATAWLPPLPPHLKCHDWPSTVSSRAGNLGALVMMSRCSDPTTATSKWSAIEGTIDNAPRRDGVLSGNGGVELGLGSEPLHDALHGIHGLDIGRAFGHRIKAAGIGKRIEIDGAVISQCCHHMQQLDRFEDMHGSGHQSVIALAIAVIQMDAEQFRMASREHGSECRHLIGIEEMGEVQRDAEIVRSNFPSHQQGRADVGHQGKGARLVRLVFDGNVDCRIVATDFADRRDFHLPGSGIIDLTGVVEAILTHP